MKRFSRVLAAGLAIAAVTAIAPGASVPDTRQRVTPTQQGQGERQNAPQQTQAVVNETEKERWARLRGRKYLARLSTGGGNRSPGDRAHKRMKHRRASGRAA